MAINVKQLLVIAGAALGTGGIIYGLAKGNEVRKSKKAAKAEAKEPDTEEADNSEE